MFWNCLLGKLFKTFHERGMIDISGEKRFITLIYCFGGGGNTLCSKSFTFIYLLDYLQVTRSLIERSIVKRHSIPLRHSQRLEVM